MTVELQICPTGNRSDPTLHQGIALRRTLGERRGGVVVSMPVYAARLACHGSHLGSIPRPGMLYFRCKNPANNIRDCVTLMLFKLTHLYVILYRLPVLRTT